MPRAVSLPMYAAPADSRGAFWQGLRRHLLREGLADVPEDLGRPDDLHAHWLAPDLLLSQTCGYPLMTTLAGRVRYVGTPRYAAAGCDGALYSSVLIVRDDDPARGPADLAGYRAAFNGLDSQSGMSSLRSLVAPLAVSGRFFGEVIETGAHRVSIEAVRSGRADVAAIDVVTYALLERDTPGAISGLRIIGFTEKAPGLPLITSLATSADDVSRLRAALSAAFADPDLAESRAALLLAGFDVLPDGAYDGIRAARDRAAALGYPDLA